MEEVLAPLLELDTDDFDVGVDAVDLGGGMVGAKAATVAFLEAKEVAALRLRLDDDAILEATVGKTPVQILQEHCHRHVDHHR